MKYLSIDRENYNKKNIDKTPIEVLNNHIKEGKGAFILFYMINCTPCNETKPHWYEIKNKIDDKNTDDILIVDLEQSLSDNLDYIKTEPDKAPGGFPTMIYKKGNDYEAYENASIPTKDRRVNSFVEWINSKRHIKKGGRNNKYKRTKKNKRTRNRKTHMKQRSKKRNASSKQKTMNKNNKKK